MCVCGEGEDSHKLSSDSILTHTVAHVPVHGCVSMHVSMCARTHTPAKQTQAERGSLLHLVWLQLRWMTTGKGYSWQGRCETGW